MMGFSGLMMGGFGAEDDDDPTPADIGRFIPQSELQAWWAHMQRRYPQVFPASDPCPSRQWPKDTKIRNYFDGDRSQEMNAIILGSKMTVEPFFETNPAYVVRCPPNSHKLSYIHLTDVHEEDGWQVVQEEPAGRGNTPLPSPEVIKIIALEYNYEERRDEASNTLFFKDTSIDHNPTLINVFYTTGGVMTKLSHPTSGYNQLWRCNAYDSVASLAAIFENPRVHTGKGYRNAGNAVRGCVNCGKEKKRSDFSNNQWRKGQGESKCTSCVHSQRQRRNDGTDTSNEIRWESIVDSITCDAEGCHNTSPAFRCQSCFMVYYCSEACKRRHQHAHSEDCLNLEQFLLLQAESIHQFDGDWDVALEIYRDILRMSVGREISAIATPSEWRQVWMGLCRCYYELGEYDQAISAGTAALEMNRHFPQVHRYIALAHRARGDHAEAVKTMKQAVLYEDPWCDETMQFNKDLLRQLMSRE